jgi:serine/threonine-protein kinase HipA
MLVEVTIWNQLVGVLAWNETTQTASFEFSKNFRQNGLNLSPVLHPLSSKVTRIDLPDDQRIELESSKGLPLFISDALPDKFGTTVLLKYLEREGRSYRDLNPIEKLTYIGNRGMGAMEFKPASVLGTKSQQQVHLGVLKELALSVLTDRPIAYVANLTNLFQIGTSAGGAQPKVLINIDTQTGAIYRGDQIPTSNHESWILKFNRDTGSETDREHGKIEYVYYQLAKKSGIEMMHSQLLHYEGESFFMTQRFDRLNGVKIHTQTAHAMAGMNYRLPNTYSYEQLFSLINRLNLGYKAKEQLFRTMVFNVVGRNVDDHTKNFGFSMNPKGEWSFSPAYDLTFSYNDNYKREKPHFLSLNGKNNAHDRTDLIQVAKAYSIKKPDAMIDQILVAFDQWQTLAKQAEISTKTIAFIESKLNRL